jgi:2-polyprenyl-3-methyl-5-hydroxy-6-metoxy-1,4-benzoquinol methylase
MSASQHEAPASFIGGSPTRPWYDVPGDHRRPTSPERFNLYWDEANQFGMVHPRAKDPLETLVYYETQDEPYYTHRDHQVHNTERVSMPFPARVLVRLAWMADWGAELSEQEVDSLRSRKPATILDVGCGTGNLLDRCRRLGHTVHGVEPDPAPRRAALSKGLDVSAGTCEALPETIKAKTFDVIIISHVLHNCIDPKVALRNVADRLAPGGHLICEVPNQQCLGAWWSGLAWAHLDIPRQLNVFTLESLSRLVEQSPLRVERIRWAHYCRQFHPRTIEQERRKYDYFKAKGSGHVSLPRRPATMNRFGLLACSVFARPKFKYDAVRIIARKS